MNGVYYIATFFTHSGAIKYKRQMAARDIPVELAPVPRRLSSDCGICARFSTEEEAGTLVSGDVDKLFAVEKGKEILMYAAPE